MRAGVKAGVVLLVTLPMLAYVAGRLAAVPPEPAPRSPVIIDSTATPLPESTPVPGPDEQDDGEDDVLVVNPSPTPLIGEDDDDEDDSGPEDDDRTDDDTAGGD